MTMRVMKLCRRFRLVAVAIVWFLVAASQQVSYFTSSAPGLEISTTSIQDTTPISRGEDAPTVRKEPDRIQSIQSPLSRDSREPQNNGHRHRNRPKLTSQLLHKFIVVPEYKLLFCYVEKTACSMFNHLFRMLRLLHPDLHQELNHEEALFQASGTWYRNPPSHHNLTKYQLEDLLVDPHWKTAVFYRDPASRFLSAFQSKCVVNENGGSHCKLPFGKSDKRWDQLKFRDALRELDVHSETVQADEHYKPAHQFCGGLGTTLEYYDVVHPLHRQTLPHYMQQLFHDIRVNSNTSDHLIRNVVETGGTALHHDQELLRQWYPESNITILGSRTTQKTHNTGSSRMNTLQASYENDENLKIVHKRYAADYDLFQLPRLSLAELQNAGA